MNSYEKNIQIYQENEKLSPSIKCDPDKPFIDFLYGYYLDTETEMKEHDESELRCILLPITKIDNYRDENSTAATVVAQDTITCAKAMLDEGLEKVVILNFASQDEMGGGYTRGANAQEEDICRVSTLYYYLNTTMGSLFYSTHGQDSYIPFDISGIPKEKLDNISYENPVIPFKLYDGYLRHHNNIMLLSENITVFREPSTYKMLDKPYQIDVLSCAAPINYLKMYGDVSDPSIGMDINIIRAKIRLMLYVFKRRGYDNIVLGAWGCGAYGNDPNYVAQVFKEELSRYDFNNVRFAIPGGEDSYNCRVFKSIIEA